MTKRVWIAQCICPGRHAILALSGEAENAAEAEPIVSMLRIQVGALLEARVFNPWCSLCHAKSETWRYEVGRTRFTSMEEAKPHLEQNQREQAAVNAAFGDIPRSD